MTGATVAGRSSRAATVAFWAAVAIAVPVVAHLGRRQWFGVDDWFFLVPLDSLSAGQVVEPYWGHWTTVPRLWESLLYTVVGVEPYLPYLLGVLLAHLGSAVLLRTVALRAGCDPWTTTALAVFYVTFGPGAENIIWGFQFSMTGSLVFGLAHLVLTDHDGGRRRRDGAAIACGLLAVASTNVGLITAAATGLAVLLRRGWRSAVLVVGPVVGAYAVWWAVVARDVADPARRAASGAGSFTGLLRALAEQFLRDAGPGPAGVFLAAAAIGGTVVLGAGLRSGRRSELACTAGLTVGAGLLGISLAYTRGGRLESDIPMDATPTRYLHLLLAFSLPAIVLGASALVARWRWVRVAVVAGVIACLPQNLGELRVPGTGGIATVTTFADVLWAYDTVDLDGVGPQALSPRWLVEGRRAGRIPPPRADDDPELRDLAFAAMVVPLTDDVDRAGCSRRASGVLEVAPGERVLVEGRRGTGVVLADIDRELRSELVLEGSVVGVVVRAGPLQLLVEPDDPRATVWRCG